MYEIRVHAFAEVHRIFYRTHSHSHTIHTHTGHTHTQVSIGMSYLNLFMSRAAVVILELGARACTHAAVYLHKPSGEKW